MFDPCNGAASDICLCEAVIDGRPASFCCDIMHPLCQGEIIGLPEPMGGLVAGLLLLVLLHRWRH